MEKTIHLLTGCTAVGKTELALRWAEQNNAEIVSCDSLLFYRGMDIGTAKPTRAELERVPHHLIDVCEVKESMNVARYIELVRAALADIAHRGRKVLVTGGSGFYLKAFLAPVTDDVDVPQEIRDSVRSLIDRDGLAPAVAELRQLNPEGLGDLDVANPRRVARALERCRASSRTLLDMKTAFDAQPAPFNDYRVVVIELVREKGELDIRIAQRVEAMIREGLVSEVKALIDRGLKDNASAARAIGYRETIDMLEGRFPAMSLADAIIKNTRALVKKQRTWFRTQLPQHETVDANTASVEDLFD